VEGDEPVKVLAVAPDGRWLAAPGKDWTVQVWDVTSNHRMAVLTDTQTWVCSFAMLLGRLELFTVLVLFTRAFWKK